MSFGGDLAKFSQKTGIAMDLVVKKVAMDVDRDLVLGTPVDTGHARANWFIGTERVSTVDKWQDKSGALSMNRAATFASTLRAGGVFYITNNVPYIMRLEYGHSQQAPVGWARATVSNWQKTVDRIVREVAK